MTDVFFLGAGFEVQYGQPLMRDVYKRYTDLQNPTTTTHNLLTEEEREHLREDCTLQDDLNEFLKLAASVDPTKKQGVEHVMDCAKDDVSFRTFCCLFFYALLIDELIHFRKISAHNGPQAYEKLLQKNCIIITTNYTSFPEKEHPKRKAVSNPGRDYPLETTEGALFGFEKKLVPQSVLKLHGGVMLYAESSKVYRVFTDTGKNFIKYADFKKDRSAWGEHTMRGTQSQQVLVPPTKRKDGRLADLQKELVEFRNIWKNASKAIKEAERIFIIGYSLPKTDVSVIELLKTVAISTEVIFVSKDPDKKRVSELFKKAKFFSGRAEDFLPVYLNNTFSKNLEE